MSTNKNLFKDAIADAKSVREAAMFNAKAALEEALTPRLQSMISAKLQEDEALNELDFEQPLDTGDEEQQSGFGNREQGHSGLGDVNEEDLEEDFDLSEILAELDEAKKDDKEEDAEEDAEEDEYEAGEEDAEDAEDAEEDASEESDEDGEEEVNLDPNDPKFVEELTALIKTIVNQEMEAEEAETPGDEAAEDHMDMGGMEMGGEVAPNNSDEIDLEELLAELDALDEDDNSADDSVDEAKKAKDDKKDKEELKEAIQVINTLRNELNEVNLLNAKLLFVNKLFNSKNLTESQKLKVIASFDKAATVKEAKAIYESLKNAITAVPAKKAIKESLGFASKAVGSAPNKTIVESNDVITRMQKLANIIK